MKEPENRYVETPETDAEKEIRSTLDKYATDEVGIILHECNGVYNAGNFPENLPIQVKDYLEAHHEVISSNQYSVQFRIKKDEN